MGGMGGMVEGGGSMHSAVHCAPPPDLLLSDVNRTRNPLFFPCLPEITLLTLMDRQYLRIRWPRSPAKIKLVTSYVIYLLFATCNVSPLLHFLLLVKSIESQRNFIFLQPDPNLKVT